MTNTSDVLISADEKTLSPAYYGGGKLLYSRQRLIESRYQIIDVFNTDIYRFYL